MPKESGVGEGTHATFGGAGAVKSLGDSFQPNLAMGGGSYKIPMELPAGPGGLVPQIELLYDTSAGNGPFGLGWSLSLPTIEERRPRAFLAAAEPEFNLGGLPLVKTDAGDYVASVAQQMQRFALDGNTWTSRTLTLVELRFGGTADSRVELDVDGVLRTHRWHVDRMRFPGGRDVLFEYSRIGNQLLPRTIRWSVFRLEFLYEDRPDPWSQFDAGFEMRMTERCRRIEVHQDRLPDTLMRAVDLEYVSAEHTGTSLLTRVTLTGFRRRDGAIQASALPSLAFDYTTFSPEARRIERFTSSVVPPPGLSEDVTLVDLGGCALPGVFRLDSTGGTYWENRGGLRWGPPQPLPALPSGIALSDPGVRFADMEGRGTADLVVGLDHGGGYYPNRPGEGFARKQTATIAPTFDLGEADSHLIDLDGDRVSDFLTFRNGAPLAFINGGDGDWLGPSVLVDSGLPPLTGLADRVRMADMSGDGQTDVVLLRSRQIVYWPYLGEGTWADPRVMSGSPDFGGADVARDVFLSDLNGDGAADLVVVATSEIRLYLNRAGEGFAEPIVLTRTPRASFDRLLLADMKGSGTAGLLFTSPAGQGGRTQYWFLDLLDGVKPNLLARIDNGCGLITDVTYSTSAFERARDLDNDRRWTGYLPFVVPVVGQVRLQDLVTGETSTSVYRYHDGHFDGRAREYLGFAEVECTRTNGPQEQPLRQRLYYHTRQTTASDPAFIAGRGQPHRTETFDPDTDELRQFEESTWTAIAIAGTPPDEPAYLAVETKRSSQRLDGDAGVYESEATEFEFDAAGNPVRETRTSRWRDSGGVEQTDVLRIENTYASHAVFGLTSLRARLRKIDGAGALLKDMRFHYDGAPMAGLPLGQVENGFRVRQSEVALTPREIAAAYGGVPPALLATLYRTETDPDFGLLYLRDVGRARVDASGNEVETIDARGLTRRFTFDAESIHPVTFRENGGSDRIVEFDPIAQQVSRLEDLNGLFTVTEFDALGNPLAVFKRDAAPGLATESYEYRRNAVPHSVVARLRVNANDAEPGCLKIDYLDGCGRKVQTRMLGEDGRWAVGKQERASIQGRKLRVIDAYFSDHDTFDAAPPAATAEHETDYDALGRVVRERLFNGRSTRHRYAANRVEFFDPDAADALAIDPGTPPSRESVTDAGGLVRSIIERDGADRFEQRRDYDVLRRLVRLVDPLGHTTLENVYDLWGNHIRVRSSEGGITTFVFDGGSHEVLRTDADGRVLATTRDAHGRITELRDGGALVETYEYDAGAGTNLGGRLARVAGQFGTVEYGYSPEGQATVITRTLAGVAGTFVTRFDYNCQRQVTRVTYPDGADVQYQYAANGMLRAIPGFIDAIEYGPTGLRTRILYANGLETRRGYTPGDYLINELLTQPAAGGPRYQHLVYELDGVGQAVHVGDLSTVTGKMRLEQQYTYDARHRLVHASGSVAGFDFAYEYDDLGNLVGNGETGTTFEYRTALGDPFVPNRLVRRLSSAAPEFDYDASGNLTRDPDLGQLTYDSRHRLVTITRPNGSTVEYRYDHNDRRVMTIVTTNGAAEQRIEIEGLFIVEGGTTSRVVFDENRRLAVVPAVGDPLIHHFDRLGNVNVLSNGNTGAFVGHDEYTPYGRLFVSIVIQPAFTFQGGRFSDGLELVLLGARHYRPALGRFLTCDPYLIINQDKIPPLLMAANLYVYAYCNPANFTDATGEIAPLLVALIVAAIVGAIIGAIGAGVNGAKTWDEWLLWIVGGAIGGVLSVLFWYGILVWAGVAAVTAAVAATIVTLAASILGLFTPLMDESDSGVAWAFSWAIKLIKSPVFTILGLFVTIGFAAAGKKVDFRRGALFVETGPGSGAITLGAIVYTQSGLFDSSGHVRDDVAKHEAYHTRTVAALGEWGFYVTYITFGSIFAAATGGPALGLDNGGCGNPFEKHAYTYFNHWTGGPNPNEVAASDC